MTLSPLLQALGATLAAAFAWLWWTRRKATQRADAQERRAERAEADRDTAIGTAAAESTARLQREVAATTTTEVAHVAAQAAAAHPEDPDAAGAAADQYARERHARLHADRGAHGPGPADPVPRDPAPGSATRGR